MWVIPPLDVRKRYNKHVAGKAAKWTVKYPPLCILHSENGSLIDENKITKCLIKHFGKDNVRGGNFCSLEIFKPIHIPSNISDEYRFIINVVSNALNKKFVSYSLSKTGDFDTLSNTYHVYLVHCNEILPGDELKTIEELNCDAKLVRAAIYLESAVSPYELNSMLRLRNITLIECLMPYEDVVQEMKKNAGDYKSVVIRRRSQSIIPREDIKETMTELMQLFNDTYDKLQSEFDKRSLEITIKNLVEMDHCLSGNKPGTRILKDMLRTKRSELVNSNREVYRQQVTEYFAIRLSKESLS